MAEHLRAPAFVPRPTESAPESAPTPTRPIDDSLAADLDWRDQRDDLRPPAAEAREPKLEEPPVEVVHAPTVDAPLGRFVVDAYDRLADRVLERLRQIRVDVDADLGNVKSELATLRQAVDDVADRVQLRQLRGAIDELRGDVAGLRRAVLEWPELGQVSNDIAGLRADMSDLLARPEPAPAPPPPDPSADLAAVAAQLGALRDDVAQLRSGFDAVASTPPAAPADPVIDPALTELVAMVVDDLATLRAEVRAAAARPASAEVLGLEPLVREVASVRGDLADVGEQLTTLKRRVGLRAKAPTMDDGDLDRIADRLAARLSDDLDRS